jgi:hypothetical protein
MTLRDKSRHWLLEHPKYNPYKRSIEDFYHPLRLITSSWRVLPNFIIAGTSRSGTTSLYHNLLSHPNIYPGAHKSAGFFDYNFDKGLNFYKSHFSTKLHKNYVNKVKKQLFCTGEATTTYLLEPKLANRIKDTVPDLKIIVILRNPIERAFSHYNYYVMRQESKFDTFEQAIDFEKKIISNNLLNNVNKFEDRRFYSFLREGMYIENLKKLFEVFPKRQLHIIQFEEFATDTLKTLESTFKFLDLENFQINNIKKLNAIEYQEIDSDTRKFLKEFFEPYNAKLYDAIGKNFHWK